MTIVENISLTRRPKIVKSSQRCNLMEVVFSGGIKMEHSIAEKLIG